MENKKIPSNNKLISIQEEKLIRQVDYDSSIAECSNRSPKKLLLEIFRKGSSSRQPSQKVLVSIKPKSPAIKTLFLAEKNRFHSNKHSNKAGSRLALGDHSSFTTHFSDNDSNELNSLESVNYLLRNYTKSEILREKISTRTLKEESSTGRSKCTNTNSSSFSSTVCKHKSKHRNAERCYVCTQPQFTMTIPKISNTYQNNNRRTNKVDIGTLVINSSSQDLTASSENIKRLNQRIEHLERKVLRQQMVFRTINPKIPLSSSDEDSKDHIMKTTSSHGQPGCSYVEYSQVPETSAFQRHSQQPAPLSASKATTIQKEHNSEQYGRDFTLYDGITTRGRRQCASVPCKRDDGTRVAADRVHKIRHKLNPVRDYRLMDTVHYLAQGEFAPRDDGIKLTPSREAVLSDIIWEDVCRTHWPNTRLARRIAHPERYGPRSELQRLIDSLLRERVAHVERRKRRHYRIVKLNHRHENCRPVGKTGDIIVASHKDKPCHEDNESINGCSSAQTSIRDERNPKTSNPRRSHKSQDPIVHPELRQKRHFRQEDCSPGPSRATRYSAANREATCCYHSSNPTKHTRNSKPEPTTTHPSNTHDLTSNSSMTTNKVRQKNPRLVVKKKSSRKRYKADEPNLEHFILLPTLVVKTPSNMKRQKKFNELYHRILNTHLNKAKAAARTESQNKNEYQNITASNSEDSILNN